MYLSKIQFFLFLLLFILSTNSCRQNDDVVPYAKVNFTIYLNDPDFTSLQTVGNYVYVTGGVSGIVIYRKSQEEFSALERCCTYKPSERCGVLVDSTNNNVLICPCCNSKFSLWDGAVMSGLAKRSLVNYQTIFNPEENTLKVYN